MVNFRNMNVEALRGRCNDAGLPTSGRKAVLIERLEEFFGDEQFESFRDTSASLSKRLDLLEKSIHNVQRLGFRPTSESSPTRGLVDDELCNNITGMNFSVHTPPFSQQHQLNKTQQQHQLNTTQQQQQLDKTQQQIQQMHTQNAPTHTHTRIANQPPTYLHTTTNVLPPTSFHQRPTMSTSVFSTDNYVNRVARNEACNNENFTSHERVCGYGNTLTYCGQRARQHECFGQRPENGDFGNVSAPQRIFDGGYPQNYASFSGGQQRGRADDGNGEQQHFTFSGPPVFGDYNDFGQPQRQRVLNHNYGNNNYGSIRDIVEILPDFDPTGVKSLNAKRFIQRVEVLRNAYGWWDADLIFAVQQKMKGAAKYWVDSQEVVFRVWHDFKAKFEKDFPCMENEADIHVQMSLMLRNIDESPQEYFYRMLAFGKRGGISDAAIASHIIKEVNDADLKKKISNNYNDINDLLHDIINFCLHNVIVKPAHNSTNTQRPTGKENIRKPIPTQPTKTGTTVKCYNCNKVGHYANKCPEPQRKNRCDICKRTNHATNGCPQRKADPQKAAVNKVEAGLPKMDSPDLVKTVRINDFFTNCFVDPGSGRSMVRKSFANDVGRPEQCSTVLNGFAGGKFICTEKVKVEMLVDDHKFNVDLLVVSDDLLCQNVLLGRDVICQEGRKFVIEDDDCWFENVMAITTNEQISPDEKQVQKLISNYSECFAESASELGSCNLVKMDIELSTDVPINVKPYRIPFARRPIVTQLVQELLDSDIIRPSTSPYASGIVLAQKKNNEYRLCVDYRALNRVTKKTPFPMPNLDEQFAQLASNKFFTSLDLKMGYHQIEMSETSKPYTAFVTTDGHFEYNRMPFGLVNAPAVFQRIMNQLIKHMDPGEVLAYLDDVIIPSKTFDEGIQRLEKFLIILRDNGLTLRLDKCKFLVTEISHLGHIVNGNGITPGIEKVNAIRNFKRPTDLTELRRFLGLTGFFRKFVENYSIISKPLTGLLKKDQKFLWEEAQQKSFENLINISTSKPVLVLYDVNAYHQVHTDASSIGIAGILLQSTDEKNWKPVFYYSRHCSPTEAKYHSYELEILAVVESLERFRVYVLGKHFQVITDCSAIAKANVTKELIPKVARWFLKIMDYDCKILHRQGSRMSHIDALSRAPDLPPEEYLTTDRIMKVTVDQDDWLFTMQLQDPALKEIVSILKNENSSPQVVQIKSDYELLNGRLYRHENGKSLFVVPKSVRWRIIKSCHDDMGHFGLEKTIQRVKQYFWFPGIRKYVKSYIAACIECCYSKAKGGKTEGCMYTSDPEPIPFRQIHIDHLGPFIRSKKGNCYVLAISDAFSKYLIVKPVRTTKTQPVINVLNEVTSYFGLPKVIISDRGTAFSSKMFEQYCQQNSIQHVSTAVRTPRANGQVERANKPILNYLRTSTREAKDWDLTLKELQWSVNSQKNNTSGFTPNELVFEFKLIDVVQNRIVAAIHDDVAEHDDNDAHIDDKHNTASLNTAKEKQKWKLRFDEKHAKPTEYNEGDLVVLENEASATGESRKLEPKYRGPYIVTKSLGKNRFLIEDIPGMQITTRKFCSVYSSDKMKSWCQSSPILDEEEWIEDEP